VQQLPTLGGPGSDVGFELLTAKPAEIFCRADDTSRAIPRSTAIKKAGGSATNLADLTSFDRGLGIR
jgi:hypothetical protein